MHPAGPVDLATGEILPETTEEAEARMARLDAPLDDDAKERLTTHLNVTLEYEINGQKFQTAGITRDQMLATFKLLPLVNRKHGKGTGEQMLQALFGVTTRSMLTQAQAGEYIKALNKRLSDPAETR
jgi:hypothetical protein